MSRYLLILSNSTDRARAINWIKKVPNGTRVVFKEPKRTLPQNDRMWAMLTEISRKALLGGQKYEPDEWKCIFLDALGQEMKFLPKLFRARFPSTWPPFFRAKRPRDVEFNGIDDSVVRAEWHHVDRT